MHCPHCNQEVDDLNTHMKQSHEALQEYGTEEYSCPECGFKTADDAEMEDHEQSHMGEAYEKEENLSDVIDKINKDNEPEGGWDGAAEAVGGMCPFCNEQVSDLYNHVKKKHPDNFDPLINNPAEEGYDNYTLHYKDQPTIITNESFATEQEGTCPLCGKYEADLFQHVKKEHPASFEPMFNGAETHIAENWDFVNYNDKSESLERIGFGQGDALKLAELNWTDFSGEVQKALEVDEKEKEEKRKSIQDAFDDEGDQPDTKIDDLDDVDYNIINESLTSRTKYECEHCNSGFRSNEALMTHHNDIHIKANEFMIDVPNKCPFCFEDIQSNETMENHLAYNHGITLPQGGSFEGGDAYMSENEDVDYLHTDDYTFPKSWDQDKIDQEASYKLSDDLDHLNSKTLADTHPLPWQKGYEVDSKWECLDCDQKFDDAGKHQEETGHHNITKYHGESISTEWGYGALSSQAEELQDLAYSLHGNDGDKELVKSKLPYPASSIPSSVIGELEDINYHTFIDTLMQLGAPMPSGPSGESLATEDHEYKQELKKELEKLEGGDWEGMEPVGQTREEYMSDLRSSIGDESIANEVHVFDAEETMCYENEFKKKVKSNEEGNPNHDASTGQFTSGGGSGSDAGGSSDDGEPTSKHAATSDKDLVKQIKGGSKNWKDWSRNEKTENLYLEIEKRNRAIPKPTGGYPKIFRDDPDAVSKMEQKIAYVEKEQAYWKSIIKFPSRDFQNHSQLGDAKWYETGLTSTKLREAKKKLEGIKAQQASGSTLTREPTYQGGRKNFYYKETPKGEALNNEADIDDAWNDIAILANESVSNEMSPEEWYADDWNREQISGFLMKNTKFFHKLSAYDQEIVKKASGNE